jgi:hypothetical protein
MGLPDRAGACDGWQCCGRCAANVHLALRTQHTPPRSIAAHHRGRCAHHVDVPAVSLKLQHCQLAAGSHRLEQQQIMKQAWVRQQSNIVLPLELQRELIRRRIRCDMSCAAACRLVIQDTLSRCSSRSFASASAQATKFFSRLSRFKCTRPCRPLKNANCVINSAACGHLPLYSKRCAPHANMQ